MSEPVIQANRNLLRNGDFTEGTSEWKKNGLSIGVFGERYEGVCINILDLSHESGVSQEIEVPKTPADNARYTLSFLCETRHVESGWLRIFNGAQELLAIELRPDPARRVQADLARLALGADRR